MKEFQVNISEDTSKKAYEFRIISVKDLEFSLVSLAKFDVELDLNKLDLSFGWTLDINIEAKQINLYLNTNVDCNLSSERTENIISYSNKTQFLVTTFDGFGLNQNSQPITIHSQIIKNFIGISISTVRGILIEKLANSEYSAIVLPAMNNQMLEEIFSKGNLNKENSGSVDSE